MTWTSTSTTGHKIKQEILSLSLLCSLFLIAGCEGSSFGDNLGQSLEPDPQLADNTEGAATDQQRANSADNDEADSDKSGDGEADSASSNNSQSTDTEGTSNEEKAEESTQSAVVAGDYKDIGKAPEEIQPYLVDLIELGLLEIRPPEQTAAPATNANNSKPASESDSESDTNSESDAGSADNTNSAESSSTPAATQPAPPPGPDEFRPNQAMTRREYARWLLAVNNQFYAGERTRKIRPGVNSSQPVFKDVPVSDPDFTAIQGLAEAGIIPSPLTGSSTTINFRPNAPLTRKDLLLWKVPLDTRQALPAASITAVQEAWGFQDADKIEPRALQAVLADYQNGDFANIRRAFNYTTLFQPDKAATRAEGAAVLWRFGNPAEGITAEEVRGASSSPQNDEAQSDEAQSEGNT